MAASYNGSDKRLEYLFQNGGGGGGGTTVVANPAGDATDMLKKLQVGNDIYSVLNEGGLAVTYHADWTATTSSAAGTKLTQELTIPKGKYIAVVQNAYSSNQNIGLFALSVDDTLLVNEISNTPISYGTSTFYFELSQTSRVAYSAATQTAMSWDSAYIDRGRMDIIALPDVVYLPEIYSTEERQIGVWINGKPLYQRTYTGSWSININGAWVNTGINISGVEFLVGGWCGASTFKNNFCLLKNGNNLNITSIYSSGGTLTVTQITIQYTKTTDVAGSGIYTPNGALSERYSTDEQIIGTWLGETLYRKVIPITAEWSFVANTWVKSNIQRGSIKAIINGRIEIFYNDVYSLHFVQLGFVDNMIAGNSFRSFSAAANGSNLIIEYTKNSA